ncbi:MAG: hypothetical protein GTO51_06800 [Candidatus Latescibacteria bacterium]|nr:hypothetical protein [Candidatus Latescibacterota bacterium]NIM21512.1 hypothetical protein [Candidatus Latescibacterota bacterium]NIM65683.1 hypothetical protein [Candidatus Latescibacterota bacterium]NIO02065.1 hypothetical protein [Candidatus Latescibacterota bacterium]NIO28877.1 hypothetical protein [Candidatus Latescibacterota bacterium]
MLIRPRRVRRSGKFTSKWASSAKRRKEQTASLYSTAAIQLVLFFFLIMGSYKSYLAIETQTTTLGTLEKLAVPGFFIIAAIFVLRAAVRNLLEARSVQKPSAMDGDRNRRT